MAEASGTSPTYLISPTRAGRHRGPIADRQHRHGRPWRCHADVSGNAEPRGGVGDGASIFERSCPAPRPPARRSAALFPRRLPARPSSPRRRCRLLGRPRRLPAPPSSPRRRCRLLARSRRPAETSRATARDSLILDLCVNTSAAVIASGRNRPSNAGHRHVRITEPVPPAGRRLFEIAGCRPGAGARIVRNLSIVKFGKSFPFCLADNPERTLLVAEILSLRRIVATG